jgi:hypothetical protein
MPSLYKERKVKKLALLWLSLMTANPVYAGNGINFIGTEAVDTLQGAPNIYYQMGLNPRSALRFQLLTTGGNVWLYGGYRLYFTEQRDGIYAGADIGVSNSLDLVITGGIEFHKDNYIFDPHLKFSQAGTNIGFNIGYAF